MNAAAACADVGQDVNAGLAVVLILSSFYTIYVGLSIASAWLALVTNPPPSLGEVVMPLLSMGKVSRVAR